MSVKMVQEAVVEERGQSLTQQEDVSEVDDGHMSALCI